MARDNRMEMEKGLKPFSITNKKQTTEKKRRKDNEEKCYQKNMD